MKSLITFGANVSGGAYKGTLPAAPVQFVAHQFDATDDGQLLHSMDGRQCALVPPAGFDDYVRCWPDCKPVVATLRGAEGSAATTTARAPAVKKPAKKKKR